MSASFEYQEKFVTQLKSAVANNISLADELTDLLNVSTDSIYRRLRCQSAFTFHEMAVIARKFNISIDSLINHESTHVAFKFNPLFSDQSNFLIYQGWIAQYLTELAMVPGVTIIYAADDLPVFRHFNYPHLSAFKSFYWLKAVLNYEALNGKKFNQALVPQEIIDANKKTYSAYAQINSIEIWSVESLTSTLKQVEFFWESDLFESQNQVKEIIVEIRDMMDGMKTECENNFKSHTTRPGTFMLYNAEVMIGNNCVFIDPGNTTVNERVFIGLNTINSISTDDLSFRIESRLWMENLIKKSLLLSGTAEKQRARFFRTIEDKINALERSILNDEVSI